MRALDPAIGSRIIKLVTRSETLVMAFDPTGAATVPVPDQFIGKATAIGVASPLDPLAPAGQGKAVAMFEHARRTGSAVGTVELAGNEERRQLHLFDLTESHQLFLAIIGATPSEDITAASPDLVPRRFTLRLSATGVMLSVDEAFSKATGWSAHQIVGTPLLELIHPDDHEASITGWAEVLDNPGGSGRLRQRLRRADDSWLWIEATDHNRLADPAEECVFADMVDISHEMETVVALHRREALLARLAEALPTGILHLDDELRISFSNPRWFQITGMERDAALTAFLARTSNAGQIRDALETARDHGIDVDMTITIEHTPSGTWRHGRLSMRPLPGGGPSGRADGVLLALEDTTEAQKIQTRLADEARRDSLTGLLNRAGILEQVEVALTEGVGQVAVLYVDLDDFKTINDGHSHALGDAVLCAVADRLDHLIRPEDHVGRLGGDEFLVVLTDVGHPDDAFAIAQRLESEVSDLSGLWGDRVHVQASVGVALAAAGEKTREVVNRADVLMYERKARRAGSPLHWAAVPNPTG